MIKNYLNLFFILFLIFQNAISQQSQNTSNSDLFVGHVYSEENNLPISNVTIKTFSKNGSKYFVTDENGKFEIPNNDKNKIDYIEISSLGFKKLIKKTILDTIYLATETNQLDEIIINSKSELKDMLSFFEKLNTLEANFSWDNKAATFIPKNKENKEIRNLLYAVSDFKGVKNLKYLPFKANLYSVDSLGMPNKPILEEDILVKKENDENWVKVDISKYKITIPEEGVFVVFIILGEEDYKYQDFIRSYIGWISPVPALKAYKYNKNYIRKSYIYRNCSYPEKCNIWLPEKYFHYLIDVEY
ncbi:carboxypeptidase-like regulatory domain-containing protein [Flavobacterium sp. 3-210]